MSQDAIAFSDSIPRDYDAHLGPFLFEPYAADLAARLTLGSGARLLETACGTGISTEFLRRALDERVEIVATDLSQAMLDVARERRGHLPGVRFQAADAAALPFEDGSFDAVAMQFGLMFLPDKVAALREARRVLRPDGRLVFNVWDDLQTNPYVQVAQDAIAAFFEAEPPQFLYLPWSLHERGPLRELVAAAGFDDARLDTVAYLAERPSARDVALGLVRGNPTLGAVRERARGTVDEVVDAVSEALGREFGAAPFRAPMRAVVVTARRAA